MKPALFIVLFSCLALPGCRHLVGPDHAVPQVPLPDRWSSGDSSTEGVAAAWWRLFGEAELNRLQSLALATNQDLIAAMHQIDEAQADFKTTKADLLPGASTGSSTDRSQSSANGNQFPGFTPPEVSQYRLRSNLNYELDLWGKVRRSMESKRASLAATAYARDAVMLRLTGEVADQYFALRALDAEKGILEDTITLRRSSLAITETKFKGGLTSESDFTRALSTLASAEGDMADIIRRRALAENGLAELCGQSAGSFRIASRSRLPTRIPVMPKSSPATLLLQRPDIAGRERLLAARNAEIGVAMGERLPSFRFNADISLESLSLDDLLTSGSRAFNVGPELSIPLFTGGANKARIEKARARHAQASSDYLGAILTAVREVEDALTNQRGYRDQAGRLQDNATAAARTTQLSIERYKNGLVDYLEVVDSQREELLARRSLVQARAGELQATVLLMKSLGGGWAN